MLLSIPFIKKEKAIITNNMLYGRDWRIDD